jgi:YD repeat-containing protein
VVPQLGRLRARCSGDKAPGARDIGATAVTRANRVTFVHDSAGQRTEVVDARGYTTTWTYDARVRRRAPRDRGAKGRMGR